MGSVEWGVGVGGGGTKSRLAVSPKMPSGLEITGERGWRMGDRGRGVEDGDGE